VQLYYAIQSVFIKYATANHKFPNEYIDVIFIQIDQHLKILLKKIHRGPDFMKHGVHNDIDIDIDIWCERREVI